MTTFGPELLVNGNFEASTGTGAASSIGPGWGTDYLPCGPNLFAAPCGGARYAFFTTNAGQVTGNAPTAVPIAVIGTRSMAVNVSGNTAAAIVKWSNIPMVNGQSYRMQVTAAIINNPFAVAVRVNGGTDGVFPVSAPSAASTWQTTVTDFVYQGPTGNQLVGLYSNSGVLGGNDHTFDDISLRSVSPDGAACGCCPVPSVGVRCWESGPLGSGVAVSMLCGGVLTWFDTDTGNVVPTADIVECGTVCCRFGDSSYTDVGNGGLHCFDQPAAGTCDIPAGTWRVTGGGDTSPYFGAMLVAFSDGQKLFEQPGPFNCGDFGEVAPPISHSDVFTFAGPVTATLFFEQDNGEGVPHPITSPFVCYGPA